MIHCRGIVSHSALEHLEPLYLAPHCQRRRRCAVYHHHLLMVHGQEETGATTFLCFPERAVATTIDLIDTRLLGTGPRRSPHILLPLQQTTIWKVTTIINTIIAVTAIPRQAYSNPSWPNALLCTPP